MLTQFCWTCQLKPSLAKTKLSIYVEISIYMSSDMSADVSADNSQHILLNRITVNFFTNCWTLTSLMINYANYG